MDIGIPMRWRNVAFWAKTLLAEDRGAGLAGECRVCKALPERGEPHHRACSRERLMASLIEIERDLPE